MTSLTRQIYVAIVIVLAALALIAALRPTLSPHAIHAMHVVGWLLGALDVLVVAASFLMDGGDR